MDPDFVGSMVPRSALPVLVDIFASTMMWTLFLEIISLVWFFAVVQMDFSGYEIFLLSPLSLGLLANASIRKIALTRQNTLLGIGLLGFLAPFADNAAVKLVLVAVAVAALLFHRFSQAFLSADRLKRAAAVDSLVTGLLVMLILRRTNGSLNPMYYSRLGASLTLVAGYATVLFAPESPTMVGSAAAGAAVPAVSKPQSSALLGAAFGSFIHLVCYFATETAVHTRSASLPVDPWSGMLLLLACIAPLLPRFTSMMSVSYYAIMCLVPGLLFHFVPAGLPTLACAALVMVYTISAFPFVVERCVSSVKNPGRFFVCMMAAHLAFMMMGVYSSVYKFVPGGFVLRESPYVAVWIACVLCAFLHLQANASPIEIKTTLHLPLMSMRLPSIIILFGILFSSVYSIYYATPHHLRLPVPHKSGLNVLTTMVWNVRYIMDDAGSYSYDRVEQLANLAEVDVMGLIETEHVRIHTAARDSAEYLSKRLGMYGLHGPSPRYSSFGNALFSRYPFVMYEEFVLPSPEGEIAPAIEAVIDVRGALVRIFLTHFGNTEDELDLKLQSGEMARRVRLVPAGQPIVFLSYITSTQTGVPYMTLTGAGLKDTVPEDTHRYCEYILYRDAQLVSYADLYTGPISDTESQFAQFVLGGMNEDDQHVTADTLVRCCGNKETGRYSAFDYRWPFGRRQSQWAIEPKSGKLVREFLKNERI
jgi:hypothetical protein